MELLKGGDEFGHPGVSLYHNSLFLGCIVSTGSEFWMVEVIIAMENKTWNNVGFRWNLPSVDPDTNKLTGGLEVIILHKMKIFLYWSYRDRIQ